MTETFKAHFPWQSEDNIIVTCVILINMVKWLFFFPSRKRKKWKSWQIQPEESMRRLCQGGPTLQREWCPDPFLAGLQFKLQYVLWACKWNRLRVSWHRSYMICNIWHNFDSVLEIPYKWARISRVSSVSPGQEVSHPRIYRAEEVLGVWQPYSFPLGHRSKCH